MIFKFLYFILNLNKSDKEKAMTEKKRIISIMTGLDPDKKQQDILSEIFRVVNNYKHRFFKQSLVNPSLTEKDFRHEDNRLDRRWSRSVEEDVVGMKDSIQSNRKNYLADKKDRLVSLNKTIQKISHKYYNALTFPENFSQQLPGLLKTLRFHYRKKALLEQSIRKLNYDLQNHRFSICFGSKKLFSKQFNPCVTHSDWQRQWQESRYHSFRLTGAKDETCGNANAQLHFVKNNCYSLKLRIPLVLEKQYGKYLAIDNIHFPEKTQSFMQNIILANNDKSSTARQPLTISVSKIKGKYRLTIQCTPEKVDVVTTDTFGVVGMDMNADNITVADIDRNGKIQETKIFRFNLNGKSTGQRENIIIEAINKAVDFAQSKGKDLIYEDLDFSQKKQQLYKSENKDYNRMLSSFSYLKMKTQLLSRAYKCGVRISKVNPAYTSLTGRLLHSKRYGLSVHEAAAYAIARKYYEIKEIIKKIITLNVKGKTFMFTVPEKILKSESRSQYRLLQKWFKNLWLSQSTWKLCSSHVNPSG